MRREDGFTLVEVLVAATLGFVVLAATLGLLESTTRFSTGVLAKTDSMQRGRLALDRITQVMRSQVCPDLDTPAVSATSTATAITFYSDLNNEAGVTRRRLDFASGDIRETTYAPTGTTPTGAAIVLENVSPYVDEFAQSIPYLRYFAYQPVGSPPRPVTSLELKPPLTVAQAARVARIEIAFVARPVNASTNEDGIVLLDQVTARHADPNLSVPDPVCT